MKVRTALTSAVLAAALVVPGAADAHKVSSSQTVTSHVRAADRALLQFESSVAVGADTTAATALARNRRQMRAAAREARRVRRSARGVRATRRAATATARVGLQANADARVLAAAVDEVDGALQSEVAADLQDDLLTGAGPCHCSEG